MGLSFDPIAEARRQWVSHGWSGSAAGMAAVTTLVRVHQLVMARVDSTLEPYGLSFARFEILRLLAFSREGQLPMGKIGARLQVHPASVTSAVKRLEQNGLVQRVEHPADSRSTIAVLTPAGRRRLEPATAALNLVFASLGLTDPELNQVIALLNGIRQAAGDPVGSGAEQPR